MEADPGPGGLAHPAGQAVVIGVDVGDHDGPDVGRCSRRPGPGRRSAPPTPRRCSTRRRRGPRRRRRARGHRPARSEAGCRGWAPGWTTGPGGPARPGAGRSGPTPPSVPVPVITTTSGHGTRPGILELRRAGAYHGVQSHGPCPQVVCHPARWTGSHGRSVLVVPRTGTSPHRVSVVGRPRLSHGDSRRGERRGRPEMTPTGWRVDGSAALVPTGGIVSQRASSRSTGGAWSSSGIRGPKSCSAGGDDQVVGRSIADTLLPPDLVLSPANRGLVETLGRSDHPGVARPKLEY